MLPTTPRCTPVTALVRIEGGSLRWRDDGTAPTATDGILMNDGEALVFDGDLSALQFIRLGTTTIVVHTIYYGA
jgi:hypothetical protein